MISIFITFFSALFLLFFGLKKKETQLNGLASLLLLTAAVASYFEYKGLLSFSELFGWVPSSMLYFDPATELMASLMTFFAAVIIYLLPASNRSGFDVIGLMMFSLCGGLMMVGSQHLIMLFLGIEILSIPLYVLAGSDKENLFGNEAALKYFLMGAFSTAIFLLGSAFLYGGTGTLQFNEILTRLTFAEHFGDFPMLIKAGFLLVSVGLFFKVSAVPFHFWSPDVYEGSPNRVATFMAIIVKIAGFSALAHVFLAFSPMSNWSSTFILSVAILTILGGNLAALAQQSYKRMLAYSSISHAGYLMLILIKPTEGNFDILTIYLSSYALGTVVLFYLFDIYQTENNKSHTIFTGMSMKNTWHTWGFIAATLTVAGIPSTIGFIAKYQLFFAAFPVATWGVIIGLVGSAISISYYFKPFRVLFKEDTNQNADNDSIKSTAHSSMVLVFLVILIALFGLWPNAWQTLF